MTLEEKYGFTFFNKDNFSCDFLSIVTLWIFKKYIVYKFESIKITVQFSKSFLKKVTGKVIFVEECEAILFL
jgi:hypothetical protein